MGRAAEQVDAYLTQLIGVYHAWNKPVMNTEFGNLGQLSNVDPVKWRVAVWSAFMNESSLLFWGMSGGKVPAGREHPKGNANAYIGPDTRQHFRVFLNFVRDLPVDMRPVPLWNHTQTDLRTYAVSNGRLAVIYIHHYSNHQTAFQQPWDLLLQTGPGKFRMRWFDPVDGREICTEELATEHEYLSFRPPPVLIDLACRVERVSGRN